MKTRFLHIQVIVLLASVCHHASYHADAKILQSDETNQDSLHARDEFTEHLHLKPLPDGKLLAHFNFTIFYRNEISKLKWENKFQFFPLSMAEVVSAADLHELEFSITRGNWNYGRWGRPPRPSPPGAEIGVMFSGYNENPEKSWRKLVNILGGKFCASLASADHTVLVKSKLAFQPEYPHSDKSEIYYATLPEENLCTENLTPFKKLLPCNDERGLSSLLNAVKMFKSSYSSIGLDMKPTSCSSHSMTDCQRVRLTQSVTIVFNPLLMFEGKQAWSITKLFGTPIKTRCPVASKSSIGVDITSLDDLEKLYPKNYDVERRDDTVLATYDINKLLTNQHESSSNISLNVGVRQTRIFRQTPFSSRSRPTVELRTHVAGRGGVDGHVVSTITNNGVEDVRITYMDVLPYFLRIYLHTITIRIESGEEFKPDEKNFRLSDGITPTLIEFSINIPPKTNAQVSYLFERAFLRWSDHRPDASKGTLLRSTSLTVEDNRSNGSYAPAIAERIYRIYSRPLLIILPTPDFSMPYNVICLVLNVLVIAFTPLFSLTTGKTEKTSKDKSANAKPKID